MGLIPINQTRLMKSTANGNAGGIPAEWKRAFDLMRTF